MTSTSTIGFAQAAQQLGVSIRTLRQAIHNGNVPAPEGAVTAVSPVSTDWIAAVQEKAKNVPGVFKDSHRQKVPAFARYEGTSAWRKYARRVRDFNHARA